jgi:SAM-dependent methyltransferase
MSLRLTGADAALDLLMPPELRHLSSLHWTPLDVALRAVPWLAPTSDANVLDVGSGVGKPCLVGALTGIGTWTGVEHQRSMVLAAAEAARRIGADARARFIHADALAVDWTPFSSFYFYNPFEIPDRDDARDLPALVADRLASLRAGVRVVTYHGLGVDMPACFALDHREDACGGRLAVWTHR